MSNILKLVRWGSTPHGTFGELTLPSGKKLYTIERPWEGNSNNISCIPAGCYPLVEHTSRKMQTLSRGKYQTAWMVSEVVGRTLILLHVANTMFNLEGCIGLGLGLGWIESPSGTGSRWAVTQSSPAIDLLMEELSARSEWVLDIRWAIPEQ
jgi:hypothetical protein